MLGTYTLAMLLWLLGLGPVPSYNDQPQPPAPPAVVLSISVCPEVPYAP